MTILITGANGQLGSHLRRLPVHSRNQYLCTDIDDLDITCPDALYDYINQHQVEAIVNCAAYTNVDRAESDADAADRINHLAVQYMAQAMRQRNGLLVHISTDYVFGGNLYNTPCTEEATPNPTGVYGRTKLLGEEAIWNSGCRHLVLRTSWLYSEYGHNFCKTMRNLIATRSTVSVVFDQVGTPTYAGDLAQALYRILEEDLLQSHEGRYHFSNEGVCSWYDFAKEIARQTGNTTCQILPCHSSEYPSPVTRPSYSVLDKTKFKSVFGLSIPYWTDSLSTCLRQLGTTN